MVNPDKLVKLSGIYLNRYLDVGTADLPELLQLADAYDNWFLTDYIPFLESQLTISKNIWQLTPDSSSTTITAGRYLENGCARIIVSGVDTWLNTPVEAPKIIDFYKSGVDLWKLNREMLGLKFPRNPKLDKRDADLIKNYLGIFAGTWKNHLNKHLRTVNRFVDTGQMNGWTTQQFIDNCTCPDGHIIGFRYGNARYSWAEHLRRFGVARPKIITQAAQAEWMQRNAK
jgi:hypothetical protein